MSFAELADHVGMSGPAVAERVRKLEDRGAIVGYAALLDPQALSLGLTAYVFVSLSAEASPRAFLTSVARMHEVVECHHLAGDDDYLLKVHVDGTRGLETVVSERIKSLKGVARTRTTVVLSTPIQRPLAPAE